MDVTTFLEPTIDLKRIAELLDGLGHEGRLHTVRTWTPHHHAEIYKAAKGFRPLELDFVAPVGRPLEESVHYGHNTMPLLAYFKKRFANVASEGPPEIAGFNDQTMSVFSGPGYFTVTKGEGEHEGELVLDYDKIPKRKVEVWPPIRPNDGLIGGIAFGGMIDYLRGISTHVSIGIATKGGKSRNTWFALVREDPA